MSVSTPCPADHPMMVAWTAYKQTEEYANSRRWAAHEQHVDGSLWAAFCAGFGAKALLAAPAEGQQPAEPPGQESGGSGSERAACRYPACSQGTDPACDGPCTPAPAQGGQQAVGQATQAVRKAQAGEGGTLTLSMRRSEWETLSPEAQKLIESRALDRAWWDDYRRRQADGRERLRDVPLTTTPASAPSADLSAAIRALPLPEPDGFRTRYKSEPGMIGHYPWTYADFRRLKSKRAECDYEDLLSADKVRALLESAASLVRATPKAEAVPVLWMKPDALADHANGVSYEVITRTHQQYGYTAPLYATPPDLAAELRECREALEFAELQLTNVQPHIEQACYPGRAKFIDNYVDPVLERIRAVRAKGGAA